MGYTPPPMVQKTGDPEFDRLLFEMHCKELRHAAVRQWSALTAALWIGAVIGAILLSIGLAH